MNFFSYELCNNRPGLYSAVDPTNNDTYPSDLLGLVKWTSNYMWDEMGGYNNNIANVTLFEEMKVHVFYIMIRLRDNISYAVAVQVTNL